SLGYHQSGVETSRPSASVTCRCVASQLAATGMASLISSTKVVIPGLLKSFLVIACGANDFGEFACIIAQVDGNAQVAQPYLCFLAVLDDVNMGRLPSVR